MSDKEKKIVGNYEESSLRYIPDDYEDEDEDEEDKEE